MPGGLEVGSNLEEYSASAKLADSNPPVKLAANVTVTGDGRALLSALLLAFCTMSKAISFDEHSHSQLETPENASVPLKKQRQHVYKQIAFSRVRVKIAQRVCVFCHRHTTSSFKHPTPPRTPVRGSNWNIALDQVLVCSFSVV